MGTAWSGASEEPNDGNDSSNESYTMENIQVTPEQQAIIDSEVNAYKIRLEAEGELFNERLKELKQRKQEEEAEHVWDMAAAKIRLDYETELNKGKDDREAENEKLARENQKYLAALRESQKRQPDEAEATPLTLEVLHNEMERVKKEKQEERERRAKADEDVLARTAKFRKEMEEAFRSQKANQPDNDSAELTKQLIEARTRQEEAKATKLKIREDTDNDYQEALQLYMANCKDQNGANAKVHEQVGQDQEELLLTQMEERRALNTEKKQERDDLQAQIDEENRSYAKLLRADAENRRQEEEEKKNEEARSVEKATTGFVAAQRKAQMEELRKRREKSEEDMKALQGQINSTRQIEMDVQKKCLADKKKEQEDQLLQLTAAQAQQKEQWTTHLTKTRQTNQAQDHYADEIVEQRKQLRKEIIAQQQHALKQMEDREDEKQEMNATQAAEQRRLQEEREKIKRAEKNFELALQQQKQKAAQDYNKQRKELGGKYR